MHQYDQNSQKKSAAKELAKQRAKHMTQKVALGAAKKGLLLFTKALCGLVGLPLLFILLIVLLVFVLLAAFYSAMPMGGTLLDINPDPRDAEIRQCAEAAVEKWNVRETWLVAGEGSWYPDKGTQRFGRLVDRYGRDAKLANQWGDAYAPALVLASQTGKDWMRDVDGLKARIDDAAEKLRPYFYYKKSKVITCTPKEDEPGCTKSTRVVYLLVEAYTIRGHYQYRYEWKTVHYEDGGWKRYEECVETRKLADGLENYLGPYLTDLYGLSEEEKPGEATRWTFECGDAFSAQRENLAWLLEQGSLLVVISGASVPSEFRDHLNNAEDLTGIPVWFLSALIEKESSWDPNAENETTGCFGLTQLHPDYWPEWAERYGFDPEHDKWNPRAQIIVGAHVLAEYGARGIDWDAFDSENPPEKLLKALARYGGYGDDVDKARRYIEGILELADAYRARPAVWPVDGPYEITSWFGERWHPVWRKRIHHDGIDIAAACGTNVLSISGGVVIHSGWIKGYGYLVMVRDTQHEYLYAHLQKMDVRVGNRVIPGTVLGEVGSTGTSTGCHLHFGLRPVGSTEWIDPRPLLDSLR